jgi:hypothetical protein
MIKRFSTGEISEVSFDPGDRYLEIHWRSKRVLAYRPVPEEVVRRLCNAPNPATYFEDRVAEEYPKVEPRQGKPSDDAKQKLNDLFGG